MYLSDNLLKIFETNLQMFILCVWRARARVPFSRCPILPGGTVSNKRITKANNCLFAYAHPSQSTSKTRENASQLRLDAGKLDRWIDIVILPIFPITSRF